MTQGWLEVAGCYTGPFEGYQAHLDAACAQPYSTCPCADRSMPRATTQALPTMTPAQRETAILPSQGALQPVDLVRPLPSIVTQEPIDFSRPCTFAEWVDQNKLLAGGLLAVLALAVWGKR